VIDVFTLDFIGTEIDDDFINPAYPGPYTVDSTIITTDDNNIPTDAE